MQTFITLKIPKAISVGFVLLVILVISTALYSWNRDAGATYTEEWWNKRNSAYNSYSADCANYVSQCLIAMGVSLSAGPGTDNKGCIPNCDNLDINLRNSQGITPTVITWPNINFPSNLRIGDVITFGDITGDYYRHAVFVVEGTGANVPPDAHSNNQHKKGITWWYGSGANQFRRATFYHKP